MTAVNLNRAIRGPVTAVPIVAGKGVRLVADTQNNRWVVEADDSWEDVTSQFTKVTTNLTWYNFTFYRNKATNMVAGTIVFKPSANISWSGIFSTANEALKPLFSTQVGINTDTSNGGVGTIFQFGTDGSTNFAYLTSGKTYYCTFFYVCSGD